MQKFGLYFIAFVLLLFVKQKAFCQYYFYNEDYYDSALTWSTGVAVGGMNCLTDIGGKKGTGKKFVKDVNWSNTRPCAGLFAGANYKDIVGVRLELLFGQVKASDNILKNDQSAAHARYIRNLNFRSNITEISFSVELYPFAIFLPQDRALPVINPYIVAGIASFNFCPQTFYNNSWINLPELHTEGEGFAEYPDRKPYKLTQLNMPFGLGFKYEVSPVLNFHFEIIYRKLWTDYFDDVSKRYIDPRLFGKYLSGSEAAVAEKIADRRLVSDPGILNAPNDIRGNDKNNDSYFSGVVKIAFIIGRQKR